MKRHHPTLRNVVVSTDGRIFRDDGTERIPFPGPGGYLAVSVPGPRKTRFVHALVLQTFVGEKPADKPHSRHRDDNKYNNRRSNLCYGTAQDNADDKKRNGRVPRGTAISTAKVTERDVRRIRVLARAGWSPSLLCRVYPIKHAAMTTLIRGGTWAHVPGAFAMPLTTRGAANGFAKLTAADAVEIARRYDADENIAAIATDFNVSVDNVRVIGKRKGWAGSVTGTSKRTRNRKLTVNDVARIRRALHRGVQPLAGIARDFGVSYQLIAKIRDGHVWSTHAA